MSNELSVRVWDPLIRVFHWSLVLFVSIAWVTGDEWETLHVWAGYTIAALILFRLVWGVIGTHHARFTDFVYSKAEVGRYLRSLLSAHPKHYTGHNPAGGWMVIALLMTLSLLAFTGMVTLAQEGEGILAGTLFGSVSGGWVDELHEFFANFLLLLIGVHIAGVIISSLIHRENLIRSMFTGFKSIPQEHSNES